MHWRSPHTNVIHIASPSRGETTRERHADAPVPCLSRGIYSSHERRWFWSIYSIVAVLFLALAFVGSLDLFSIP